MNADTATAVVAIAFLVFIAVVVAGFLAAIGIDHVLSTVGAALS